MRTLAHLIVIALIACWLTWHPPRFVAVDAGPEVPASAVVVR